MLIGNKLGSHVKMTKLLHLTFVKYYPHCYTSKYHLFNESMTFNHNKNGHFKRNRPFWALNVIIFNSSLIRVKEGHVCLANMLGRLVNAQWWTSTVIVVCWFVAPKRTQQSRSRLERKTEFKLRTSVFHQHKQALTQDGIPMVEAWRFARRTAVGVRVTHPCDLVHKARSVGLVPAPMIASCIRSSKTKQYRTWSTTHRMAELNIGTQQHGTGHLK